MYLPSLGRLFGLIYKHDVQGSESTSITKKMCVVLEYTEAFELIISNKTFQ